MAPISVCILGGTGFVGSRLVTRLVTEGHRVKVLTRNREVHRDLLVLPDLDLVSANVHDAGQLAAHFDSFDVIINLVGILNERGHGGAGFRRVHTELAAKVVGACRSAGVKRLLHMSSLGADAQGAPSHYLRTKGEAEVIVREGCGSAMDYAIFRPSVIFGPGDSFTNRFAQLLRLLPGALPLARSHARLAPVYVGDVVEAMVRSLHANLAASGRSFELCGPRVYTLAEIVRFISSTLGLRRWVFGLPDFIGRVQGLAMDFVPGKPFSTDNYRSLLVDSVCRQDGLGALGITAQPMEAIVRQYLGAHSTHGLLDGYRHLTGRG